MSSVFTNLIKGLLLALLSSLFFSCANQRDYVYFQKSENDSTLIQSATSYTPTLVPGDVIAIGVSATDPDVVKPFNVPSQAGVVAQSTNTTVPTYLIDEQGEIDFPVLGNVKVSGLSSMEAIKVLKDKIKTYVNNPILTLKIQNHKVTVLGEVKVPGVYPIPNEKLTLTEALAMAGDLQISGVRKNVLVVREVNGIRTETRVDLTSRHLFSSPVYYLRHNDVVYVEPSKGKILSSSPTIQYASLAIVTMSLIVNIINVLAR